MGADIHAFVETKRSDAYYDTVAKVYLPRDYGMFGLLAGVRGSHDPVFTPRGIPEDLSWGARNSYYYFILEPEELEEERMRFPYGVASNYISTEEAEEWVKLGAKPLPGNERYLSNPYLHSASYLNARELEQVLAKYQSTFDTKVHREYLAVLDYMFAIPEPRIVFWFDS